MKSLSQFIREEISQATLLKDFRDNKSNAELHKLFGNDNLDLNETVVALIDKYCLNGGSVGYECQDNLFHDHNTVDAFKVDSAVVNIPDSDITYNIDVYKCQNGESYTIFILGDTSIYIFGNPMKTLQKLLVENQLIAEGENTELNKYLQKVLHECIETGKPFDEVIDEGIFTGLLGGLAGATVGSSIMKALCKVLGIDEKGVLGGLLTSRVVMGAMGANLGYRV